MSPSLMDGFVAFLVISLTIIITTFTAMWVDRAGLGGSNHKIDSWWGRPIKRSDYEPSETSFGVLIIFIALIGGFFLSIILVDLVF